MNCAPSSEMNSVCDANLYDVVLLDGQLHFPWVTERKMELVDNSYRLEEEKVFTQPYKEIVRHSSWAGRKP